MLADRLYMKASSKLLFCQTVSNFEAALYTTIAVMLERQGCILTFFTTLAKFNQLPEIRVSRATYTFTYTGFIHVLHLFKLCKSNFNIIISSIIVANEHFHIR